MVTITDNVHSYSGRTDIDHIPPMPVWIGIIRILQFVLAIILVGLTGYAAHVFNGGYYFLTYSGFSLCWFTFAWTLLFFLYIGISAFFIPIAYNYWAHIAVESITALFWLITFAVLASDASGMNRIGSLFEYLPDDYVRAINCSKASAGLGALEWLLFVTTLVCVGIFVHQHRMVMATTAGTTATAPVTEEHKMQPMDAPPEQQQQQPYEPQVPV